MSSLGQLVAGLAHEIDNPIDFIYGNLDYARYYIEDLLELQAAYQQHYPEPPPELRQCAEQIDLEFLARDFPALLESMRVDAERIRVLVKSLRSFARLDEVDFKRVDLRDNLDSTLLLLQHRLAATSQRPAIAVAKHYAADLPLVECQPEPINQVAMNILTNAIDALDEAAQAGGQANPVIAIHLNASNATVELHFADNRPGMDAETQAKIFNPLFAANSHQEGGRRGNGPGVGDRPPDRTRSLSSNIAARSPAARNWDRGRSLRIVLPLQQSPTCPTPLPAGEPHH